MTKSLFDIHFYFDMLAQVVTYRVGEYFNGTKNQSYSLPSLDKAGGPLAEYVREHQLGIEAHYMLLIALAPQIRPAFFDQVIQEAMPKAGDFPQIGGVRGKQFRGFLPTGETAMFLLAGTDWLACQELFYRLFAPEHIFARMRVLWVESPPNGEPAMSGKLILSQSKITYFTTGKEYLPPYSSQFPARALTSKMKWCDVVLNHNTHKQLDELRSWINHNRRLMKNYGMEHLLSPGYRALFYGPPGTGKTLCATLLGQEFKRHVFRIDLSTIVSKYIGETEKNLARLFDDAENENWILFFDEADAIFGKRTQVKDAHDRYANQEVSYLMQRIETYTGLIILASNLKANMDEAFNRRFQSMIFFPYPNPQEQLQIWEKAFPAKLKPKKAEDLHHLSQRYKLSAANIRNIVQYCCLTSLANKEKTVSSDLLLLGIQRELLKEGK